MAKIFIEPGNFTGCPHGGERITKIAYDDNEPPKNHIWCKPNGIYYVYNGHKWVPVNEHYCGPDNFNPEEYYDKDTLDVKLQCQRNQILGLLKSYVDARECQNCNCDEQGDGNCDCITLVSANPATFTFDE